MRRNSVPNAFFIDNFIFILFSFYFQCFYSSDHKTLWHPSFLCLMPPSFARRCIILHAVPGEGRGPSEKQTPGTKIVHVFQYIPRGSLFLGNKRQKCTLNNFAVPKALRAKATLQGTNNFAKVLLRHTPCPSIQPQVRFQSYLQICPSLLLCRPCSPLRSAPWPFIFIDLHLFPRHIFEHIVAPNAIHDAELQMWWLQCGTRLLC